MNIESAKGKVFEVYNAEGNPINGWNNVFSELKPDAKNI